MATDKSAKPSRLLRGVLIGSLALNLAVVGIVAGAAFSGRYGGGPPRGFNFDLGPIARALSPADRKMVRDHLRNNRELRELRSADRAADQQAMVVALRNTPFDIVDLEQALASQRNRGKALEQAATAALLDQIAAMSPVDRAAFADRLERELHDASGPHRANH